MELNALSVGTQALCCKDGHTLSNSESLLLRVCYFDKHLKNRTRESKRFILPHEYRVSMHGQWTLMFLDLE